MTSGQIKLLTLLFALVNVWLLFHIPAVGEATLKFISVGEIPGTNKSLSPDVMLYLAAGSFVVAVVLIFWREFRKLFKRRRLATPAIAEAPATEKTAIPTTQAVVVVATTPASHSRKRQVKDRPQIFIKAARIAVVVVTSVRRRVSNLFAVIRKQLGVFRFAVLRALKRLAVNGRVLAVRTWRWLVPQAKRFWALTVRVAKAIRLLAIELWRWLEPHIRRFDRWLEVQLHNNQTTANALNASGKAGAVAAANLRKLRRLTRNARDNARNAWRTTDE